MTARPLPDLTADQTAALARVRSTWGDDPQAVGVEDGTEDDFGDLICETLQAVGVEVDDLDFRDGSDDSTAWDRVQAAASYCDAEDLTDWARVLLAVWNNDPVWVEPLYDAGVLARVGSSSDGASGPTTRYAIVHNARSRREAEAYLPDNYRVIHRFVDAPRLLINHDSPGKRRPSFVIAGEDDHGWTLDGYVIPRYASGLIACEEIDLSHPIMKEVMDPLASA